MVDLFDLRGFAKAGHRQFRYNVHSEFIQFTGCIYELRNVRREDKGGGGKRRGIAPGDGRGANGQSFGGKR